MGSEPKYAPACPVSVVHSQTDIEEGLSVNRQFA